MLPGVVLICKLVIWSILIFQSRTWLMKRLGLCDHLKNKSQIKSYQWLRYMRIGGGFVKMWALLSLRLCTWLPRGYFVTKCCLQLNWNKLDEPGEEEEEGASIHQDALRTSLLMFTDCAMYQNAVLQYIIYESADNFSRKILNLSYWLWWEGPSLCRYSFSSMTLAFYSFLREDWSSKTSIQFNSLVFKVTTISDLIIFWILS